MAQRMRSNNTTLIAIRMDNEIYDKMEEIRALTGDSRTDFIKQALAFRLADYSKKSTRRLKNEI